MADENGMITAYALVCVNRNDLKENKKENEEKTEEDKVVQ